MIKEYFIINNKIDLLKVEINQAHIIIHFKVSKQLTKYYKYLFKYLYKISPTSLTMKIYDKYYTIIILTYLLCL